MNEATLRKARNTLASICVAAAGLLLILLGRPILFTHPEELSYDTRAYNELTKNAVDLGIDQSKSLFQLGLLILGSLWALVFAKKDETKILLSDTPEVIMFVTATLLLLFSEICHLIYLGHVRYFLAVGSTFLEKENPTIPDLWASPLANQVSAQVVFFGVGALIALLTLISAHRLK
jgi:hypothetical protein